MNIRIISVGKIKDAYFIAAIEEYAKRLSAYVHLEMITVADERIPERCSLKEKELVLQKEGDRILNVIKRQEYVLLLDLRGPMMDSESFATYLDHEMTKSGASLTMVIGGSLGLSSAVKERANGSFALSKMTFTHALAKVILLEQIYRAFRLLKGEPYHK